jgi:hypothetical protein
VDELTLVSGTVYLIPIWNAYANDVTGLTFFQTQQGNYTGDSNNLVALYTFDSTTTLTRRAISTNNANLWKATANTWATELFASPYSAGASQPLYVGLLYHQSAETTAPKILATNAPIHTNVYNFTISPSSGIFLGKRTGQTTCPSSIAISDVEVHSGAIPMVGIY